MQKQEILVNQEKCRKCMICQLVCSLQNESVFSPSQSRIKVGDTRKVDGRYVTDISFSNDCTGCGLCVVDCPYGALSAAKAKPIMESVGNKSNVEA